jgi:helix-turn-helix protein
MPRHIEPFKRRWLTTTQSAGYTGIPASTLRWMRYVGVGPRFCKPRGRVLYDVADLDAFMDSGRRVPSSVRASKEKTRNVTL